MDPITGGLTVVGLGLSIFGGLGSAGEAKKQAELSKQVNQQESIINQQKQNQMMLSARRQQLENTRNVQRARAMGLQAAVSQGAQFGTGFLGGQAQIASQGNENATGMNQGMEIGQNIFAANNAISGLRSQMSDSQSAQAGYAGIASIGSALSGSAKSLGNMSQGMNFGNIFGSSGNYSGTPGASNTGGLY